MNSNTLREVAAYLLAQANVMESVEQLVPMGARESAYAPSPDFPSIGGGPPPANIFAGSIPSYGPVPVEFQSPNTYGTRPDIGSPGWQASLRSYALRDGLVNLNKYVTDRNLIPIWPNDRQAWDQ